MTLEEKLAQYEPKSWDLYCNNNFIESFPSHKAAKRTIHKKCMEMQKYPYDYTDEFYTIKPHKL